MQYEILAAVGNLDATDDNWGSRDNPYSPDLKLEKKVKQYIAKGWRPLGGVSVALDGGALWCFQAMTKE